ncbi:MAG: lipT [Microbacteriaceae bacterium]|nr:lipT [Microbacteriaceae bacterium]
MATIVGVTGGQVRGVTEGGVESWRGIPYARPPVGPLRFRAPGPVIPWRGVRDGARFGTAASQYGRNRLTGAASAEGSGEDCLTINVQAPEGGGERMPVMVFIHGGGYSAGSSRDFSGQGEGFIRAGPVVYVSFNYRLGAFGYLDFTRYSTPERPFESNLGLRDQLAALEWVRDNIRAFGGDPGNVTVFGESAGANAVTTLMAVPRAAGLFARAIAQSSPPDAVYPPATTATWAAEFVELLGAPAGADDETVGRMLATASVDALVDACTRLQTRVPDEYPGMFCLAPVIDGELLPEHPMAAFRSGRAHRVPLIIGTNEREGSIFRGRIDIIPRSPARIGALFQRAPVAGRELMRAAYPNLDYRRNAADFGGDYGFWFPSTRLADFHSRFAPVWSYRFDFAPTAVKLVGLDATHGLELFTLFDRLDVPLARVITSLGGRRDYADAGRRMRALWTSFAATGDPGEAWPPYSEEARATLVINATDSIEHDPRSARRLAWNAFLPHLADRA